MIDGRDADLFRFRDSDASRDGPFESFALPARLVIVCSPCRRIPTSGPDLSRPHQRDWEHSPARVTSPGMEAAVMGPYYPRGYYTTKATFEAEGARKVE
jgi:hypothetical protein